MSADLILWRTRQHALLVAERQWLPILTNTFKRFEQQAIDAYSQTRDLGTTAQMLEVQMTPILTGFLHGLYYDNAVRFMRRRAEQVKTAPTELRDWNTWEAISVLRRVTGITRTTIKQIREAKLVDQRFDPSLLFAFSGSRISRVLKTELNSSANAATHFSVPLEYSPERLTKKWFRGGTESRSSHAQAAERAAISYASPFALEGSSLQFPGDTTLGADIGQVVSCRCCVVYFRI